MNKIFHYRLDGTHNESLSDDPWSQCLFNDNTDLSQFAAHPLVTIGKQPIIKQHQATYLTGRDTCHAHHFAKMVAGAHLAGSYTQAPSLKVNTIEPSKKSSPSSKSTTPRILWIDTIHSPYACAEFYQEMKDTFHFNDGQFHLMCLDILGVFREDFCYLIGEVEQHIRRLKPTLVVIDDIDHFMPYCGINAASHFDHIFRDALNHTETAFLLIGYNHPASALPPQATLANSSSLDPIPSSPFQPRTASHVFVSSERSRTAGASPRPSSSSHSAKTTSPAR